MSTYRYKWKDPNPEAILRSISPSLSANAAVSFPAPRPVVDVTLVGETSDDKIDLDAAMLSQGWSYDSQDPPNPPKGLILRQETNTRLLVDTTTTGTSFTTLLSTQITTEDGVLTVIGAATSTALVALGYFRIVVDGVPLLSSAHLVGIANIFLAAKGPITAGLHTVELQWRTDVLGTLHVRPISLPDAEYAGLIVRELSD